MMFQRDTNAPRLPWARMSPTVAPSSWFTSRVNVPSPLSNAPIPSGMPTRRYPPTLSPTVRIDVVLTPGPTGRMYGLADVLGPMNCADAEPARRAGRPPRARTDTSW